MSNDTLQNLDEETFRPDHGTDNHGIQYSCGHINPLQRALNRNTLPKLATIKTTLESFKDCLNVIIEDVDYIKNEVMEFAKTRCEEIRSINSELRQTVDDGCSCSDSNSECDNCYNLENDKENLIEERDDLENRKSELEIQVEELETTVKTLKEEKENFEISFKEIKEKYSYLKCIFDEIVSKE